MNSERKKILAPVAALIVCAMCLVVALLRPALLSNYDYIGGAVVLEVLLLGLWKYKQAFLPLMLLAFFWAGLDLPVAQAWSTFRWFFLGAAALAGLLLYVGEHQHRLGLVHFTALACTATALVSGVISQYPLQATLKAISLLLLFLYCITGARLALRGREQLFISGLLLGCGLLTYLSAISYFVFGYEFYGNPNSLGAVMGVALVPSLLWGILTSTGTTRSRRIFEFGLAFLLLFSSHSRAGIGAGVLGCVFLCGGLRRFRLLAFGGGALVLVAVAALLMAPLHPSRIGGEDSLLGTYVYKGAANEQMMASRHKVWDETVASIRQHPWFGTGFGTSDTGPQFTLHHDAGLRSARASTREHGNSYLAILEWVGLLGSVPFYVLVALLLFTIKKVAAEMWRSRDPYSIAIPFATIVLAGCADAFFEDWLFAVGYYLCVFVWSIAFLLVDLVPATSSMPATAASPQRVEPWMERFGHALPTR